MNSRKLEKSIGEVALTKHARLKLQILRLHGFELDESYVADVVKNPGEVFEGMRGRLIAQKALDEQHLIRVI